jgi:hypothetical protein
MRHRGPGNLEGLLVALVVATLCLYAVADILPRLYLPIAVLAVVFALVRVVLFHTRKW